MTNFEDDDDYEAFEQILLEGVERTRTRLLALSRKVSWVAHVNTPHTEAELVALRRSVERGSPFGGEKWSKRTIQRMGLESRSARADGRRRANNGS